MIGVDVYLVDEVDFLYFWDHKNNITCVVALCRMFCRKYCAGA